MKGKQIKALGFTKQNHVLTKSYYELYLGRDRYLVVCDIGTTKEIIVLAQGKRNDGSFVTAITLSSYIFEKNISAASLAALAFSLKNIQ